MKILYKQCLTDKESSALIKLKINNCYFKEIIQKKDYKITTSKLHWHDVYEIHMIVRGEQHYEIDGVTYELGRNEFIIISPKTRHRVVFSSANLVKYSVTFNAGNLLENSLYHGEITESIINSIEFIAEEYKQKKSSSFSLIENRVFEILVLLLRISGYKEKTVKSEKNPSDYQLGLAKKFISDNIEHGLSVEDVADYCHISSRQLSRIFVCAEGISPAKYICGEKMKKISEYLKNSDLSLKQISEKFSYADEYYFNAAFKKYFGIPPLAYRKMYQ